MLTVSALRQKAVLIHLAVSAVLIGAICIIALFLWFPSPIFLLDGTWLALLTLGTVDLLLGPFITLVISSDKKRYKELLFDYTVVLCIQLAALAFGLFQIYDQRVVALVHVENQFHLVARAATPKEFNAENLPSYKGMRYGMLMAEDFLGMSVPEIESTMYNPQRYRKLTANEISRSLAPVEFVPDKTLKKYGEKSIYKFIAGKKQHGVAVFNRNLEIIDIVLEKRDKL